jgi:Tol biopolymer transport system component
METARRSWVPHLALTLIAFIVLTTAIELDALAVETTTRRVSVGPGGEEGDGTSNTASISADGRFVAFQSYATNLVGNDTNSTYDVFVRDRKLGRTRRMSVSTAGAEVTAPSYAPSISADGRFVAFQSYGTTLVAGDTNGVADIFVRDRKTGTTRRVSLRSSGAEPNGESSRPSISADGRFVAFQSDATNLVGGDANGAVDIFVRDRENGTTRRVSVSSMGTEGNGGSDHASISANGRFVAFDSGASNLVGFDMNGVYDVFVHDRMRGKTRRVSVSSAGTEGDVGSYWPAISGDGHFVTFYADASNLVLGDTNGFPDVFVHDRTSGKTSRVSLRSSGAQGNEGSYDPWISGDGRFVGFSADASNLVGGDTNLHSDVFVRDRLTGKTTRVSVDSAGTEANADSFRPIISVDGRFIAFESAATNLVNDTNIFTDVFLRALR